MMEVSSKLRHSARTGGISLLVISLMSTVQGVFLDKSLDVSMLDPLEMKES